MPIKVTCTNCGGVLNAPDDAAGKRGRCPTCGTILTIVGDSPSAPTAFGAPPAFGTPPAQPKPSPQLTNPWGSLPGGGNDGGTPSPAPIPTRGPAVSSVSDAPAASPGGYGFAKDSLAAVGKPQDPPPPVNRGSRLPPDPRKYPVPDPFAKSARPAMSNDEDTARRWGKVKRGLGWMQATVGFAFLAVLGFAVVPILEAVGVNLPNQTPGFFKIEGLAQSTEIHILATVVPVVLAWFCKFFGRIGVAGAPAASCGRGLAVWASLATIISIGGLAAYLIIGGKALTEGWFPSWGTVQVRPDANTQTVASAALNGLFLTDGEGLGQIHRGGLILGFLFGLVAELWFVAALGRYAAALQNPSAAGRINRFVIWGGLLVILGVGLTAAYHLVGRDWVDTNLWAKWSALDAKNKIIWMNAVLLGSGFIVAVKYWRMLSGVKTAVREASATM